MKYIKFIVITTMYTLYSSAPSLVQHDRSSSVRYDTPAITKQNDHHSLLAHSRQQQPFQHKTSLIYSFVCFICGYIIGHHISSNNTTHQDISTSSQSLTYPQCVNSLLGKSLEICTSHLDLCSVEKKIAFYQASQCQTDLQSAADYVVQKKC
ncbi:MAG: hypothetical protein WBQ73_00700 [Candidatus Babeliales bacterium]